MINITLSLPEDLVRDAREFDLLTDKMVENLLQAELDRRVSDLVNAEIKVYRAEKAQDQKRQKSE
ncbi:MAG: hypothetical protein ABI690_11375 [Chloroflexota bacterium]